MKTSISCLCGLLFVCLTPSALPATQQAIDWDRARELNRRSQRGEKLSDDEIAYLTRAREIRRNATGRRAGNRDGEENARPPAQPAQHFTPLTELVNGEYKGESGGLYGEGRNKPHEALHRVALRQSGNIRPLDEKGEPSEAGKIVLLSIGMSNTTQEFSRFKQIADRDSAKSSAVLIVDGAQGGQDAVRISNAAAPFWVTIDDRLERAGATAEQVQVVWIKQAIAGPNAGFPAEVERLQGHLGQIVGIARQRYPNLRIAYLSSRIYAGYATSRLNPEPYAYESAFAVRELILGQFNQSEVLNRDATQASIQSPILLWGPYLWADGLAPRKSDGLIWKREDLAADGTHPSTSGRQKVAEQLLTFFKTDPTARPWFLGGENPPSR